MPQVGVLSIQLKRKTFLKELFFKFFSLYEVPKFRKTVVGRPKFDLLKGKRVEK